MFLLLLLPRMKYKYSIEYLYIQEDDNLATWAEFLESPGYSIVINSTFTFHTMFLAVSTTLWYSLNSWSISSWIRLHCTLICVVFKSHMEWSNAQHVSTSTTTMLPTTVGTFNGLNCFGYMIHAPQTSTH